MKTQLIIIVCIIFFFPNAASAFNEFFTFNTWLKNNGYDYRVGCELKEPKINKYPFSICFSETGEPLWKIKKNNLKVKKYKNQFSIPSRENPNRDTLIYYLYRYLFSHETNDKDSLQWDRYEISPSSNPYEFSSDLKNKSLVKEQLKTKAILSYLFFENGKIIIDEISPDNRFGEFINKNTKLRSNSVGKTLVSYVFGHAICEGYIESEDSKVNDWPLLEGTLYEDQKFINFLNMTSGDQDYVYDSFIIDSNNSKNRRLTELEIDTKDFWQISKIMKGLEGNVKKYNYNIINTNLLFNYVLIKTGKNFQDLLVSIFKDKVKIENSVYFFKPLQTPRSWGNANSMFFASRYDYLRIAKAIMDDWQNDTCVGKYLKRIYKKRVSKGSVYVNEPDYNKTLSYGGQFHLDYPGLEDRIVLGMGGHGGQAILIDVETSRIVVVNSIFYNKTKYKYNHKALLINPIKNGNFNIF